MQTGMLSVVLRTAGVYVFLFALLRLLGKRELGQFTPFDMVLLLTLSNAVQNAMVGDNTSLWAGFAAAATLMLLHWGVLQGARRSRRLRRFVDGTPTLLVRHGCVEWRALRREGISFDNLLETLRAHGVARMEDADLAVLEVNGEVSVIPRPGSRGARRRQKRAARKA